MNRSLASLSLLALALITASTSGCAAPAEEDDAEADATTASALQEQPAQTIPGVAPIVFELEPPPARLNLNLPADWSERAQVDVFQRFEETPRWIRAERSENSFRGDVP